MKKPVGAALQVGVASFSLFFLETALFHILHFTHSDLDATLVIGYAMLGLGIGSMVTYRFVRGRHIDVSLLIIAYVVSVLLAMVNILFFPDFVRLSPFLILPFAVGNILVSHRYRHFNANNMYFADLLGATGGILFSIVFIPLLTTENALFLNLLLLIPALWLLLSNTRRRRLTAVLGALMTVLLIAMLSVNLTGGSLSLEHLARGGSRGAPKDFALFREMDYGTPLVRDSLVSRISVYRVPSERGAVQYDGTIADHLYWTCFNGDSNDVIDGAPPFMFRNDPRIPFMYENDDGAGRLFDPPPETFIIGTAAQGIVKSIKYLTGDPALIDTVEINPAIVSLMENDLYSESGEAYRGIDPEIIDARTWLMHNDRQFDLITMMNTYTAKNIGYFGEPDFIHTREAFQAYLDHLSDRGCILIEERDVSDTARAAIFRLINTIMAALEERGSADPSQHLFVYNTNVTKAKLRRNWYTFMVITREPMSERERAYFADWIESRHYIEYVQKQEYSPEMDFTYVYHSQLEYLPGIDTASEYQAFITSPARTTVMSSRYRLNPTTDDSPYIFDVNLKRSELNGLLFRLGITCAILLAVAVLMLLKDSSPQPFPQKAAAMGYFLFLGIAYFILEISLMKMYQSHTGSPTGSLIFVLGSLLLGSGSGAWLARNRGRRVMLPAMAAIIVLSLYQVFFGLRLLTALAPRHWLELLIIGVTVFPLGLAMGVPFPAGLEMMKAHAGDLPVPLYFSVNCIASSFTVVFGLYLCVVLGFTLTAVAGIGFYVLSLGLLLIILRPASLFHR